MWNPSQALLFRQKVYIGILSSWSHSLSFWADSLLGRQFFSGKLFSCVWGHGCLEPVRLPSISWCKLDTGDWMGLLRGGGGGGVWGNCNAPMTGTPKRH